MSNDLAFISELEGIIRQRLAQPVQQSYTAALVAGGNKRVAQKVGEEAVELALAAVAGDKDEQLDEAADLVFHLLVLLHSNGLSLQDVAEKLRQRHIAATSG